MKTKLKISLFILFFSCFVSFNSCEQGSDLNFKYSYKDAVVRCDYEHVDLISEAVYTFEDYIIKHHVFREPIFLEKGYANYWGIATSDRIPRIDMFDPHVLNVFEALKGVEGLWIEMNGETRLNPKNEIMACIGKSIQDEELKKIFNVLLDTKTYKSEVFTPSFKRRTELIAFDKALATLVALDMFYAKLFQIDFRRDPKEIMDEERAKHTHKH